MGPVSRQCPCSHEHKPVKRSSAEGELISSSSLILGSIFWSHCFRGCVSADSIRKFCALWWDSCSVSLLPMHSDAPSLSTTSSSFDSLFKLWKDGRAVAKRLEITLVTSTCCSSSSLNHGVSHRIEFGLRCTVSHWLDVSTGDARVGVARCYGGTLSSGTAGLTVASRRHPIQRLTPASFSRVRSRTRRSVYIPLVPRGPRGEVDGNGHRLL